MPTLKYKEMQRMNKEELEKRLKELRLELVKSKANAQKTGNSKAKEIRKIIARILTLNNSKEVLRNK